MNVSRHIAFIVCSTGYIAPFCYFSATEIHRQSAVKVSDPQSVLFLLARLKQSLLGMEIGVCVLHFTSFLFIVMPHTSF